MHFFVSLPPCFPDLYFSVYRWNENIPYLPPFCEKDILEVILKNKFEKLY